MLILSVLSGIGEAISNGFRYIMMSIDNVVFYFIEVVYQLIMDLANVKIFTQTTINTFTKRIYVILGLVMVFKMMISFVQILINPDTMKDKEKGLGSVLKRVVISLILIVLVPSIFRTAREIQGYILPVIPRVIMGTQIDDEGENTNERVGHAVAWYSFLPFFDYAGTCNDGSINTYNEDENQEESSPDVIIASTSDALQNINRQDKTCGTGTYHYFYEHKIFISTAVGVYLLFTLVQVAVQVAIRAIKFAICEFVAPIPIASYIDPKTSKSTFDKWVSTSIKVYLDLFIQLIVVYFVAFVFVTISKWENVKVIIANTGGSFGRATLVILFIIIGLFKFVKEFPKFLSGLLGLGTDGAIGQIFKGALDSTNLVTAGYRGARNNIKASTAANENKSLTALRAASGFLGATSGTFLGSLKGKSMREASNAKISEIGAKTQKDIGGSRMFAKNGKVGISSYSALKRQQRIDKRNERFGMPSTKKSFDYSIENLQSITDTVEGALKDVGGNKVAKYWANRYEAAKNMGIEIFEEQIMASDKQEIKELERQISQQQMQLQSGKVSKDPKLVRSINENIRKLNQQISEKERNLSENRLEIRKRAQQLQAEYVNKAEKDASDAKTRLFEFAATGNKDVLTEEDIQGSGLGSAEAVFADGGILGRVSRNLNAFAAGINDKRRDDKELDNFLNEMQIEKLDFTKLTGPQSKAIRDNANTRANDLRKDPRYAQAQFSDNNNGK